MALLNFRVWIKNNLVWILISGKWAFNLTFQWCCCNKRCNNDRKKNCQTSTFGVRSFNEQETAQKKVKRVPLFMRYENVTKTRQCKETLQHDFLSLPCLWSLFSGSNNYRVIKQGSYSEIVAFIIPPSLMFRGWIGQLDVSPARSNLRCYRPSKGRPHSMLIATTFKNNS